MREIRTSGSEGGVAQTNAPFLPLSKDGPSHVVVPSSVAPLPESGFYGQAAHRVCPEL